MARTSKSNKAELYIDEGEFERVFEVRIRDLRERKGIKQKSFSVSVKSGSKDNEYLGVDELKDIFQNAVKLRSKRELGGLK